jgi:hypothetical protein
MDREMELLQRQRRRGPCEWHPKMKCRAATGHFQALRLFAMLSFREAAMLTSIRHFQGSQILHGCQVY